MTLRTKTLLIVVLGQILGYGILYLFFNAVLMDGFQTLEDNEVIKNTERVEQSLQDKIDGLSTKASDWSSWDDMYEYVVTKNPAFVQSNLLPEGLFALKVNYVMIFDLGGRLIQGVSLSPEDMKEVPYDPELFNLFAPGSAFLKRDAEQSRSYQGFMLLGSGPLMFAARPILPTSGEGAVRGTVVFARFLDETGRKELSQITRTEVALHRNLAILPASDTVGVSVVQSGRRDPVVIQRSSEDRIEGFNLLRDAFSKPALMLHVSSARPVYAQGKMTRDGLVLALLGIGVINGILMIILIGLYVTRRLARLNREVKAIETQRDLTARVTVNGHDEVTHLAAGVNQMLEAVERYEKDLRTARDQAENASREKSMFVARMSHEVRSPLHGVLGMLKIVLGLNLPESARNYLHMAKGSAELLMQLVNDVLDFSKIEAGKLSIEQMEMDIDEVLKQTFSGIALRAHEKKLELLATVAADVPTRIKSDPVRLRQVLINLIGNAIKFTERGEIEVKIWVEERSAASLCLHFAVRDSGIGIPADKVGKLFQAYNQAEASTARKYGGTGLGLTISKQIVELLGGKIWIESTPGVGTTFHFTCQTVALENAPERAAPQIERLAVWSDSSALTSNILQSAAESGVPHREAISAEAGLHQLGAPCIVLLDGADEGIIRHRLEQARRISGASPIAMLRFDQLAITDRCRDYGAAKVVTKPLLKNELAQLLSRNDAGRSAGEHAAVVLQASRPRRILVADDTSVNRTIVSLMLSSWGHEVVTAEDGQLAYNKLLADEDGAGFDLILMDIEMPVLDGMATTRMIREHEVQQGGTKHIPIVALTAHSGAAQLEQIAQAGVDTSMSKPLNEQQLFDYIEALNQGTPPSRPMHASPDLPAAAPAVGAFDAAQLRKSLRGNKEMIQEVVGAFLGEHPRLLADLEAAMRNGDTEALRRTAHAIKGSCRICFAAAAANAAAELESHSASGVPAQLQELVSSVRLQFEHAAEELRAWPG